MAESKIKSEIETLIADHSGYYKVNPNWQANPFDIEIRMKGPNNSPYEGGEFRLKFLFTTNFPFKPPTVKFITKIYHPEIDSSGRICSECFLYDWGTKDIILGLLNKILNILKNPSSNCYIYADATELFVADRYLFNSMAAEWTRQYAAW